MIIDMRLSFSSSYLQLGSGLALFTAILALILSQIYLRPQIKDLKPHYISPPNLNHFTFGHSEAMADSLWLRALQDFDYCSEPINARECQGESWLYRMLDQITNLSPKFRGPYANGALALTVIISDYEGATKIFDKGVRELPLDWTISYRAAYHALYEEKNKEKAAKLLIQAGNHGAPKWVFSLAGRLYAEGGEMELAKSLIEEMKARNEDPALIQRLEDKIKPSIQRE